MIKNLTQNTIISHKERYCKSRLSQTFGLMFRRKQNLIMEFDKERKISLHMFFVFYPIDVLIVNEKKEIVEIKRNFKPFSFWNSSKKGKYVIELGFNSRYQQGDVLQIEHHQTNLSQRP